MKYLSFLLLGLWVNAAMLYGQVKPKASKPKTSTKQLMKDQIRQYWFVLLKTGPNTDADSTSKEILFDKHMANIVKLYNDGILKVAGPFGKNDNEWRGLFCTRLCYPRGGRRLCPNRCCHSSRLTHRRDYALGHRTYCQFCAWKTEKAC